MRRFIEKLATVSYRRVASYGSQYDAFNLFILIFYLINPLKWSFPGPYKFSIILCLRLVAILLWVMLTLWRYWPRRCKMYLPLFWYFCLLYHLPFRTTFSTLYSAHSPSYDSFGLLGIFTMAMLVDGVAFCVLTALGITCGFLVYFGLGGFSIEPMNVLIFGYTGLQLLTLAFIKLILFHNHHLGINKRSDAYKTLAGAVAHEVRGPLSTLNVMCENFSIMTADSSTDRGRHKSIQRQARKALRVVDDILLQVSCLEKESKTKCVVSSLNDSLIRAIDDAQFSCEERSKIKLDLTEDHLVLVDKKLFSPVILNLIKNALWAIQGKEDGAISINATRRSTDVFISLFDNGVGINSKDLKNIFEPFHGLNTNGTGIGLAFCKLALENMSGSMRIERGSVHAFYRPALRLSDKGKGYRE